MFWRLVEQNLSGMLKKPTHAEMDALLDKLAANTITLPEVHQLRGWLRAVYLDQATTHPAERVIAMLVLGAVEARLHTAEGRP